MKHAHVRAMEIEDLPRVGELVDMNAMFPSELLDEMAAPYFGGETDAHRWLVYDESEVAGVAYYVPEQLTEGTWNLLLIAVDKKAHGNGIGTKLMRCVEDELQDQSQRILLVDTSGTADFERTRKFYDMLGYDREACIRGYYAEGDDKITFRKSLA